MPPKHKLHAINVCGMVPLKIKNITYFLQNFTSPRLFAYGGKIEQQLELFFIKTIDYFGDFFDKMREQITAFTCAFQYSPLEQTDQVWWHSG